jgi:hypothetical protein
MGGGMNINLEFFAWWYRDQAKALFQDIKYFFAYLYDSFSVGICLTTLFDVWKRDRIDYTDLSLPEKLSAWSLNLASRFVGLAVKISVLFTYLLALIFFLLVAILLMVLWFLFPVIIIGLIYFGISMYLGGK